MMCAICSCKSRGVYCQRRFFFHERGIIVYGYFANAEKGVPLIMHCFSWVQKDFYKLFKAQMRDCLFRKSCVVPHGC